MEETLEKENKDLKYSCLKLENQLCFPIYTASRIVISNYRRLLRKIKLTYTQYITMLVLWEHRKLSLKEIGNYLFLDSGTLTPVLNQLEEKGLIKRKQSTKDKRSILFSVTEKGDRLRDKVINVPQDLAIEMNLTANEARQFYNLSYKVIGGKTLDEAINNRGY